MSDERPTRTGPPPPPPPPSAPVHGRASGAPREGAVSEVRPEGDADAGVDGYLDDFEEVPAWEEPRGGRGCFIALIVLLLLLVAIPAGGYAYLRGHGVFGSSNPGEEVAFAIPLGATTEEIGDVLVENGVIESTLGFRVAARLDGGIEDVQAGEYVLPTGLTARDALAQLIEKGPLGEEFVEVTFPEGRWLTDFARILERETHIDGDRFLDLVTGEIRSDLLPPDVDTLEGLLFPSTYQIGASDTARSVARKVLAEMEERVAQYDFSEAEELGLTVYEALIVASMVEAEAKADIDRARIARTIYNRVAEGMRLDIDATVIYGLGEHRESLTQSDLQSDSPYNTRRFAGLPPTPIGAPGEESLEAAANPEDGPWLFYVLADCETGEHAFSESYEEFLQNKSRYEALGC